MTREEAIEVLKDIYNYTRFDTYTTNEARTMAIKALEQEPCDDCVSRQVVKEQMLKYGFHASDMTVTEFIEDLPPVLPKREQGEWRIKMDCEGKTRTCICSKCGEETGKYTWENPNYCSNCGAEMR